MHSGTGRIGWIKMRPMSLWESQDSNGEVSLAELFTSPTQIGAINKMDIEKVAFLTCRGGWPLAVVRKIKPVGDDVQPRLFRVKLHGVEDTMVGLKTITPLTFPYLVGRTEVQSCQVKLNHPYRAIFVSVGSSSL